LPVLHAPNFEATLGTRQLAGRVRGLAHRRAIRGAQGFDEQIEAPPSLVEACALELPHRLRLCLEHARGLARLAVRLGPPLRPGR